MKTQRAYPRFTITRKGTQWVEQGVMVNRG